MNRTHRINRARHHYMSLPDKDRAVLDDVVYDYMRESMSCLFSLIYSSIIVLAAGGLMGAKEAMIAALACIFLIVVIHWNITKYGALVDKKIIDLKLWDYATEIRNISYDSTRRRRG